MNQAGDSLGKLFGGKKTPREGVEPKRESLSSGTKLLLAIVIPLLVVAIALSSTLLRAKRINTNT